MFLAWYPLTGQQLKTCDEAHGGSLLGQDSIRQMDNCNSKVFTAGGYMVYILHLLNVLLCYLTSLAVRSSILICCGERTFWSKTTWGGKCLLQLIDCSLSSWEARTGVQGMTLRVETATDTDSGGMLLTSLLYVNGTASPSIQARTTYLGTAPHTVAWA